MKLFSKTYDFLKMINLFFCETHAFIRKSSQPEAFLVWSRRHEHLVITKCYKPMKQHASCKTSVNHTGRRLDIFGQRCPPSGQDALERGFERGSVVCPGLLTSFLVHLGFPFYRYHSRFKRISICQLTHPIDSMEFIAR